MWTDVEGGPTACPEDLAADVAVTPVEEIPPDPPAEPQEEPVEEVLS